MPKSVSQQVERVPIGSVVTPVRTWNPTQSNSISLFRYVDLGSVDQTSKTIKTVSKVEPASAPSRARQLLETGDVLVSTVRPNLNGVALVGDENNGTTASTGFCVLRPDKTKLDSAFLFHWVKTSQFINEMSRLATGASYPAISSGIVKDTLIPFPSKDEQQRIAAVLDKADAIRRKRQQSIDLADEFLHSVFLEMFGDPSTNVSAGRQAEIGEFLDEGVILEIQDGNHGEKHPKVADFSDNGIPFVMANVISSGRIDIENAYFLDRSWLKKLRVGFAVSADVLLSHKGSVGFCAVVPESLPELILSPQVTYYRLDQEIVSPQYLMGWFSTLFFQSHLSRAATQSTRAYAGITRQKELPLSLPPKQLQDEYAQVVTATENLRERILAAKTESQNLFESLSQRAFSGEL